ncbi:MAG: HIT domain-containing protein [Bifidobacteriaceae bacterium]|nr:HIT domain-containing protein [Bifidobacteriaceae bacterium]
MSNLKALVRGDGGSSQKSVVSSQKNDGLGDRAITKTATQFETAELLTDQDFPAQEDGYERLWTPHRAAYIRGSENQPLTDDPESCPFCKALKKSDEDGLIVYRSEYCFVIMNLYPYNNGHIMVVANRHEPLLVNLKKDEYRDFTDTVLVGVRTLEKVLHPDGFNLGVNQGRVAGAGVAAHLHQHIIPRWLGDANFFPLIAQTRTIGQLLTDLRAKLAQNWDQ